MPAPSTNDLDHHESTSRDSFPQEIRKPSAFEVLFWGDRNPERKGGDDQEKTSWRVDGRQTLQRAKATGRRLSAAVTNHQLTKKPEMRRTNIKLVSKKNRRSNSLECWLALVLLLPAVALAEPAPLAMTRLNDLGPENAKIEQRVGLWDVTETVWASPGVAPVTTTGLVAERRDFPCSDQQE